MYNGKCSGVSLVVHGQFEDLKIEGNTVKEDLGKVTPYCWGISVDPGYSNREEYFVNTVIRNNKLINVGNVAIGCSSCKGAVIEGNDIIDEGNVLTSAIKVPVRAEDSVKSQNVSIRNNNIVLSNSRGKGISIGGEFKFNVNNNNIKLPLDSEGKCFDLNYANLNTDTSKNTCASHNGISIIDIIEDVIEPEPETEVVENTPEVPVEEEPVVTEPEPETEVVENTPEVPVEEPVVTEPEPETEVVDSGDNNETVTSFERPSWANQRPVGSGNFTMDSLMESMQNDYSNESASECRFFARGKCLIR